MLVDRPSGVAAPQERRGVGSSALTWLVVAALLLCAVLDAVAVGFDVSYHHLLQRIASGQFVSTSSAAAADSRQSAIGWAQLALFLVTGAIFIGWFHRAYSDLARLGVWGLRWGTKWAVGAWFVPFLNLVRPKAIANDIWRGSNPELPADSCLPSGGVPWFHTAWWAAFIVSGLLSRLAFQREQDAQTLSALSSAANFRTVTDAVDILAALLAVLVVHRTMTRQRARAASLANAPLGTAAS